jgi:hypothetical protein
MFGPIIRTILSSEWHRTKHKCSSWILYSSTADYIAMQCPSRLYNIKHFKIETISPSVLWHRIVYVAYTETLC